MNRPVRLLHAATTLLGVTLIIALGWLLADREQTIDLSSFDSNSLPPHLIDIVDSLPEPLTVIAHIEQKPELKQRIERALEPFRRLRPDMAFDWQPLDGDSTSLDASGHLLLRSGEKTTRVQTLHPEALQRAFYQLARGEARWIGFLQADKAFALDDKQSGGFARLDQTLAQYGFARFVIDPDPLAIPDNLDVLVVRATQAPFTPPQRELIHHWLKQQRPLLWLQESAPGTDDRILLAQFGVSVLPGLLVDASSALRERLGLRHPGVIASQQMGDAPVTRKLNAPLVFPITQGLMARTVAPWHAVPLVSSSEASWNETGELSGKLNLDADGERAGPLTLGLILDNAQTGQRLAVMGDSDFLANDYLGIGDNSRFALRLLTWLAGDDTLLDSETRIAPDAELTLSGPRLTLIAAFWLVAAPMLLLLTGSWLWYRRRHARIT